MITTDREFKYDAPTQLHELQVFYNGQTIYKKWFPSGRSLVFDPFGNPWNYHQRASGPNPIGSYPMTEDRIERMRAEFKAIHQIAMKYAKIMRDRDLEKLI